MILTVHEEKRQLLSCFNFEDMHGTETLLGATAEWDLIPYYYPTKVLDSIGSLVQLLALLGGWYHFSSINNNSEAMVLVKKQIKTLQHFWCSEEMWSCNSQEQKGTSQPLLCFFTQKY